MFKWPVSTAEKYLDKAKIETKDPKYSNAHHSVFQTTFDLEQTSSK